MHTGEDFLVSWSTHSENSEFLKILSLDWINDSKHEDF